MKKVFSNSSETIHIWAQQAQSEGRSSNVYFEGATVYSYGRHYPLATFITNKKGERAVVINTQGYSVTTSKHIGEARYATNHYTRFSVPSSEVVGAIVSAHRFEFTPSMVERSLSEAITRTCERYAQRLATDTTKRKAATLEKWKGEALALCNDYLSLLEWYGLKPQKQAKQALKALSGGSPSQIREKALKAAKIAASKRAKAEAQRLKERAEVAALCLPAWLAGEDVIDYAGKVFTSINYVSELPQVFLRVVGEDVQTSKGVRFPLAHGLKALPLIRAIVKRGEPWQRNGHTIHLGHYQIDSIAGGEIVAGCHRLPISEVERLAAAIGA